MASHTFDLGLGLEDTHVLVTGGKGLIGSVVVQALLSAGAKVSLVDLPGPLPDVLSPLAKSDSLLVIDGDITKDISAAFTQAEHTHGPVSCCIALASLDLSSLQQTPSLCDADPAVWQRVFDVNINGTFLTCQRWLQGLRKAAADGVADKLRNPGLTIMGSESGKFGVGSMAAYAAGKAAVQYGLLQSLAKDAPRVYARARVNAVAPGAVDTTRFRDEIERYGRQFQYEECEAT